MRATINKPRLTLTTPALGVRQWRDDDSATRIAWASAGGRGMPRRLLLVPVVAVESRDGPRWAPPPALIDELARAPRDFWDTLAGSRKLRRDLADESVELGPESSDGRDPAAPRATTVADDCGRRWGAHHLVVLVVYDEPPTIGERDDVPGVAATRQADDEAVPGEEVEEIRRFFGENYETRLVTRGLVRLPPLGSDPIPGELVFALASCQYPADMTDGAPADHGGPDAPPSASLLRLSRRLTPMTDASPSLLVLAGDQVYVDATAGLFDARAQSDRLRLSYQNLMRSPGAQSVFGLLPVAMILDDHEIVDNWEPGIAGPVAEGVRAYRRFQRMAGPPLPDARTLWCEFTHSGVPFFLADTRTERCTPDCISRHVGNWRQARIMDDTQWRALCAFLVKYRDQPAFVVSPSMLLPRALGLGREPARALECDGWDGFPASMHELLALLCDDEIRRVVFLSGDAHTSSVTRATVTGGGHATTFWSVHSSGLYCPYPFANSLRHDYAADEEFRFTLPAGGGGPRRKYHCAVEVVEWIPGDGFATLALADSQVSVRFHRAGDDNPVVRILDLRG